MKIGICVSTPESILLACDAGYDFVEVNASGCVMNDDCYPALLELSKKLPEGYMYSCNVLLPGTLRVTGDDVDLAQVKSYCEKCFERLHALGVKMIVFGSSAAKKVPEGFSHEEAMKQLVEAVRLFSEVAAKYSQRICIEPLRTEECNIINTVDEAVELATLCARDNVTAHVDYFHAMQNGEKLSKLVGYAKYIGHAHIASPCKRNEPTADDGADYKFFLDCLRRGGYDATLAIEGGFKHKFESMKAMRDYLASL